MRMRDDIIIAQRIYWGEASMIAMGLTGILWQHFCPHPWTPGVMGAQGRGRVPQAKQLWWAHLFTSRPAHLYAYVSENAREGAGAEQPCS